MNHTGHFQQAIVEVLQLLITKIMELAQQINNFGKESPQKSMNLINLHEKKNLPPRKSEASIPSLKGEFQAMIDRLSEFRGSPGAKWGHKRHDSTTPAIVNSFEYEETELKLVKLEEGLRKQVDDVWGRVTTLEEDIGQILLFCKDIILDR